MEGSRKQFLTTLEKWANSELTVRFRYLPLAGRTVILKITRDTNERYFFDSPACAIWSRAGVVTGRFAKPKLATRSRRFEPFRLRYGVARRTSSHETVETVCEDSPVMPDFIFPYCVGRP